MFGSDLKFDKNTESTIKWGQQGIHLMRKLNSFKAPKNLYYSFYHSLMKNLLTFSFLCWFYRLSVKDDNSLSSTIKDH